MPGGVARGDLGDLINHSLAHFRKRGSFEATLQYQDYAVCDDLMRKGRYKVQDGNQIEWRIIFNDNGSARHVRLFEVTPVNYVNLMQRGVANWIYTEAKAVWEARIMAQMRGESALYDYMKSQYFAAMKGLIDLLEEDAFDTPFDAGDDVTVNGIPWWIRGLDNATQGTDFTGGFNGIYAQYGDGTFTSTVGGLDGETLPMWANWVANRNATFDMQLVRTIRRGMAFTNFNPPRDIRQFYNPGSAKKRIYCGITDRTEYADLVNAGPDDRNGDVNPFRYQGLLTLDGAEVKQVAVMEDLADRPIFCVNLSNLFVAVHSDFWLKETEAMNDRDEPHVWVAQWDCMHNFGCDNPRHAGFTCHQDNT